jgi:hypothetical protein
MANEAQEAATELLKAFAIFKFTPQRALNIGMLAGFGRSFGLRQNAVEDGVQYLLDNHLLVRDGEVDLYLTELGCEKMREAVAEAGRLAAARREAHGNIAPEEIRRKRDALAGAPDQVNWCDDDDLADENMEGVGPGGWLNVFGWYVVGTTVGGNAIVVRVDDPAVYYAGHEWYGGDTVDFEDFGGSGKGKWVSAPFTAEGVRQSLFQLAPSIDEFRERAEEIDALLDRID